MSNSGWTRRGLVQAGLGATAGAYFARTAAGIITSTPQPAASSPTTLPAAPTTKKLRPPALQLELVREFVGAAHGKIDVVRTMLNEHPTLVNATWDWGNGDFETAIGGAGHMGRRDIALLLLEHNARLDLFVAAMLGHLPLIQAALTQNPTFLNTPGPHGIPLIVHAEKGGKEAEPVLAYLKSLI